MLCRAKYDVNVLPRQRLFSKMNTRTAFLKYLLVRFWCAFLLSLALVYTDVICVEVIEKIKRFGIIYIYIYIYKLLNVAEILTTQSKQQQVRY